MRAPFQVLIFPYRSTDGNWEYALFHRHYPDIWQPITGGGEGEETPEEAARREAWEEGKIGPDRQWMKLDHLCSIPVTYFTDRDHWPADTLVIPEYSFGVDITGSDPVLSDEHDRFEWLPFEGAKNRLHWQANQNALWELDQRLRGRTGSTAEVFDPQF